MEKDKISKEEAYQRHHDFYVKLSNSLAYGSVMDKNDQANYDLAIQREQQGLVKPLLYILEIRTYGKWLVCGSPCTYEEAVTVNKSLNHKSNFEIKSRVLPER